MHSVCAMICCVTQQSAVITPQQALYRRRSPICSPMTEQSQGDKLSRADRRDRDTLCFMTQESRV